MQDFLPRYPYSHIFAEMTDISEIIHRHRKAMKMTQAQFGKRIGVGQSAVSRWENGTDHPDGQHLVDIAEVLNLRVEDLLAISQTAGQNLIPVEVVGSVQGGAWIEAVEWEPSMRQVVFMRQDERYPNAKPFALEVVGESMNLMYPEGTILICVKLLDLDREPRHQERVVVHRFRSDGLVEATVKQYMEDGNGGRYLWPRSTHPDFQTPVKLNGGDDDEIVVHAVVIASYKLE